MANREKPVSRLPFLTCIFCLLVMWEGHQHRRSLKHHPEDDPLFLPTPASVLGLCMSFCMFCWVMVAAFFFQMRRESDSRVGEGRHPPSLKCARCVSDTCMFGVSHSPNGSGPAAVCPVRICAVSLVVCVIPGRSDCSRSLMWRICVANPPIQT
ncbi:hypothetical protein B0T22DRAFT_102494 [Podospora appendiculata]|uniref:Uncharacterized protein n=1 Tax=Podospora appendiculata TaxID=314037 RepID=A0AAE1CHY9_9PEZI|nr:hypothetical protein B0T22DRAFT_102494 [Podospora appendiculata]